MIAHPSCSEYFNPRSREGSDACPAFPLFHALIFQSTLPRRERRSNHARRSSRRYFNPRSREGSDGSNSVMRPYHGHFNPRSREGSDSTVYKQSLPTSRISIHAPAKGATTVAIYRPFGSGNFNPRSREGSDHSRKTGKVPEPDFNPRSREGSDHTGRMTKDMADISIHAPAKGATMRFTRNHPAHQSFQSTLPRRERRLRQV